MAHDPGYGSRPGALSMAHFAPKVAVPLILETLSQLEIGATFFIPGKSAEDFPASVEAIIAAGHEIGAHGYTHDPPSSLTQEDEEAQIQRATQVLRGLGVEVVGYRAPLFETSLHTIGLLVQYGIRYASNMMDDIKPYMHPGANVVELPASWILDDWTQFGHGADEMLERNATCAQVKQLWVEEFLGIYEHGGAFVLTMHPQVIGRPSRLRMLGELVSEMRRQERVWIAPCRDIAAHVTGTQG
jgi:peptidoglycan/xylan/chitin deacetylase (PgdA/CDA1 family)